MHYRAYNKETDKDAVVRIFKEVGWYQEGMDEIGQFFLSAIRSRVAEIDGEAECLVTSAPGTIRYLEEDLRFAVIATVTTSHVARKRGLAQRVTARVLAEEAADGALVAGLGMFEQGFYNQLGFGTGSYTHSVKFDPAHLTVDSDFRKPTRLSSEDADALHVARLARRKGHGSCNIETVAMTRFDMGPPAKGFGLGYRDGPDGAPSHFFWCGSDYGSGPYNVAFTVFRTREEFMELLALLKSLGDQVHTVSMREPHGMQLQDLISQPMRDDAVRRGGRHESKIDCGAYFQFRIMDVPGCLAKTRLPGRDSLRFNLIVTDPIAERLPEDSPWRGCGGEYVVTLGPDSAAELGSDESLPTLRTTISAFTRLWLGVQPASGLAITDCMDAPRELIDQLDWTLQLPVPHPDWDF